MADPKEDRILSECHDRAVLFAARGVAGVYSASASVIMGFCRHGDGRPCGLLQSAFRVPLPPYPVHGMARVDMTYMTAGHSAGLAQLRWLNDGRRPPEDLSVIVDDLDGTSILILTMVCLGDGSKLYRTSILKREVSRV